MNLVTGDAAGVIWYCDPQSEPRKCRSVPCHGHRATERERLVARVVGQLEGRDWDDVYMSEYRGRLRGAFQLLHRIRFGVPENQP